MKRERERENLDGYATKVIWIMLAIKAVDKIECFILQILDYVVVKIQQLWKRVLSGRERANRKQNIIWKFEKLVMARVRYILLTHGTVNDSNISVATILYA